MSKKTSKKTATAPTPVPTIMVMAESNWNEKHVKPGANADNKETSRAKWMRHVARFDGLAVAEWAASVAKKAPAVSSNPAKPYTAKQWITWFVKAGIVEVHDA